MKREKNVRKQKRQMRKLLDNLKIIDVGRICCRIVVVGGGEEIVVTVDELFLIQITAARKRKRKRKRRQRGELF